MRIGIDLGGTKIEGVVLGDDGTERARRRIETPKNNEGAGDYGTTVAAVAKLAAELAADAGAGPDVPLGVGIPGAISKATGLVKNANSTCLIGQPFDRDLAAATGRSVRLANDADCFTISEATDGAGRGVDVVFGVILGTGCGGGVAVGGKLLAGPNAVAGEWGHNPLPWPLSAADAPDGVDERPGPECYCGKCGCIETFVSGPGLEADHARATGRTLGADEIVAFADAHDPAAESAIERYEHRLARALASVINVLDPGVIVLGGGMSKADRLYRNVPGLWGEFVFSDRVDTELRPAKHGDASGVRGAAWLW